MTSSKAFKDLEIDWYLKLQNEGFKDIENFNCSTRPLKEWHSFKLVSERSQLIQANRSQYQKQIEDFFNHPGFTDICRIVGRHGLCKFEVAEIELVWELHIQGLTTRSIAGKLCRVKSRIDDILKKLRQWMILV